MTKKNQNRPQLKSSCPGAFQLTVLLSVLTTFQAFAVTNYFRFYTTTVASGAGPNNPATDAYVGITSISGSGLNVNDAVVFDGVFVSQNPGTSDQWGAVDLNEGGYLGLTATTLGVKVETTEGLDTGGNTSALFPAGTSFADTPETTNHVRIVLTATTVGSTTNMNYLAEVDPNFTGTYDELTGTGLTFANNTIALTFGANNAAEAIYDNSGFFAAAQPTPTNALTIPGQKITLTGNFEGSPAIPLAVQWFKNGSPIANATNLTYTTPALTSADNGDQFTFVLTNLLNTSMTATSPVTSITVRTTPGIVAFNFPATTVAAGEGAVTTTGVAISGTELLAGDTVVFDGIVIPNGAVDADAWTGIDIAGGGYANTVGATLGVLCRFGSGANPSQLFINGIGSTNPTASSAATNRVRIELFPSANGSTTNMGWLVEIDQNLSGTFQPAVTGTNLTFANNTLPLSFGSADSSSIVIQDPQSPVSVFSGPNPSFQAVAIGAPITVSATISGWSPALQWRKNGVAVANATNRSFTVPSATSGDNGDQFTLVVSNLLNSANVVTSSVANVSVVIPNNLDWYPVVDFTTWDTVTKNWTTNGGTSETTFSSGNNVTFDAPGYNLGGNEVTVTNTVNPNVVTVNATSSEEYQLTGAGGVNGQILSLTSADASGVLAVEASASFASANIGSGATLDVGFNGTDGVFAANNITNDGTMFFQNASTLLAISGVITGSGTIYQEGAATTVLSATNSSYTIGGIGSGVLSIASTPNPGSFQNNGVLVPSSAAPVLLISNNMSGTGYFDFTGFQTTVLTAASSHTGQNLIFWSDVYVNNSLALGDTTYGSTDVSGADRFGGLYLSNNINWIQPLELDTRYATGQAATAPHVANASGTNILSGALTFGTGTAAGSAGSEINVEATTGLLTVNSTLANGNYNPLNNLNLQGAGVGIWNGALVDSTSAPLNLVMRGTGTWTLSGVNTYSGTTTVADGTLFIDGDVGTNTVAVEAGATLGGVGGTITGAVTVSSGGTLSAHGGGTNILTIGNNLTLSPGSFTSVEINKAARTNDLVVAVSTLTYGGTLVVTNLAGTLANGDSFQLFIATNYAGAFSAISPATPGAGLIWTTNSLATNGTLGVATGSYINTKPTNITATVQGGGTTLVLSWPFDHTGWTLQMNTNLSNTNGWTAVVGSTNTNQVTLTIQRSSPAEFYRLFY